MSHRVDRSFDLPNPLEIRLTLLRAFQRDSSAGCNEMGMGCLVCSQRRVSGMGGMDNVTLQCPGRFQRPFSSELLVYKWDHLILNNRIGPKGCEISASGTIKPLGRVRADSDEAGPVRPECISALQPLENSSLSSKVQVKRPNTIPNSPAQVLQCESEI